MLLLTAASLSWAVLGCASGSGAGGSGDPSRTMSVDASRMAVGADWTFRPTEYERSPWGAIPSGVRMRSVESRDPDVVSVESVGELEFTLKARSVGTTKVVVDSDREQYELPVSAARAERVYLRPECTDETRAAYLRASPEFSLRYELRDADGERLVGRSFPVDVSPKRAFEIIDFGPSNSELGFVRGRLERAPQKIRLSPRFDGEEVQLEFVPSREAIDGLSLEASQRDGDIWLRIQPLLGDTPACVGSFRAQFTSETPDVCTVRYAEASIRTAPGSEGGRKYSEFTGGAAESACTLEVSLPWAGSDGVTERVSVEAESAS